MVCLYKECIVAGHVALLIKYVPSMHEAMHKLGKRAQNLNSITQKAETRGLGIQSHPQLCSEYRTSLGCMRSYL